MGSNLRARLDPEISCSDASSTGGGGAIASEFMAEPNVVKHEGNECWQCNEPFRCQQDIPVPTICRATMCGLKWLWKHRDPEQRRHQRSCERIEWREPKFGERFSGPHAPLTHAVAQVGEIEVQWPGNYILMAIFLTIYAGFICVALCAPGMVVFDPRS